MSMVRTTTTTPPVRRVSRRTRGWATAAYKCLLHGQIRITAMSVVPCLPERTEARLEVAVGPAVGKFVADELSEVDGVDAAVVLKHGDSSLRPPDGPRRQRFGHRTVGKGQVVLEVVGRQRVVALTERCPPVGVDG